VSGTVLALAAGLVGSVAAAGAAAAACTLPADAGQRLDAGAVQLAWRTQPAAPAVSQPFEMQVALCPEGARLLRVDATMPEHRHGMNYRPSVQAVAPGRWQVQGLLWHMPGRWELRFDVEAGGASHTLRQSVELK
jgi:hypothetical protein